MYIKQLSLKNFRCFTDVSIPFFDEEHGEQPCKTVVFIGNNGAGKSALLDALKINLSWLVARINREKGIGLGIDDIDVHNGRHATLISSQFQFENQDYVWQVAKTLKGRIKAFDSHLVNASKLAGMLRGCLTEDENKTNLPLIAYYPINRVVLDIPLKIKTRHSFGQLDGYDNALQQGVDFRRFFEWFRDREDCENELPKTSQTEIFKIIEGIEMLYRMHKSVDSTPVFEALKQLKTQESDRQLMAVRIAWKNFMPDFKNVRITRKPRLQMLVDKNGKTLDVAQLSQGEKSMMALVGDIARRLAMMNPALENPLEGFGIVMIDEIDLHLHPKWQRAIVGNLNKTFPNCQFVLTTHSPIVISDSPDLLCYALDDGKLTKLGNLYGMDVNQVLLQDMDADIRNADIQAAFDNLLDTLQAGDLTSAKTQLAKLEQNVALNNIELNKARLLIKRLEAHRAANHQGS